MTEEKWLGAATPWKLIRFLCDKPHQPEKWSGRLLTWLGRKKDFVVSKRKFQLLILAYCHQLEHLITNERDKEALQVAESYVEGTLTVHRLTEVIDICSPNNVKEGHPWLAWFAAFSCLVPFSEIREQSDESAAEHTLKLLHCAAALVRRGTADSMKRLDDRQRLEWARIRTPESQLLVNLLHETFGNPFRPFTLDPFWLTSTVVSLAQQVYESRDFSAMPILADALQDAGCDNEDVLNHCRGPGPHVRGCFVVDKLLAKE